MNEIDIMTASLEYAKSEYAKLKVKHDNALRYKSTHNGSFVLKFPGQDYYLKVVPQSTSYTLGTLSEAYVWDKESRIPDLNTDFESVPYIVAIGNELYRLATYCEKLEFDLAKLRQMFNL